MSFISAKGSLKELKMGGKGVKKAFRKERNAALCSKVDFIKKLLKELFLKTDLFV